MTHKITIPVARQEYLAHLSARGLSKSSIKVAGTVLNACATAWGEILVSSLTGSHVDRLFASNTMWGPQTRNIYLAGLSRFFLWCRRENYMSRDFDPTAGWRNQTVPKVDRLRIPLTEFAALLDATPSPVDRMVCALGLYTFMRSGEISSLKVGDINMEQNTLNMYRWKTKEADVLPISRELSTELQRWFAFYQRDTSARLRHEWYLVPGKGPNPCFYNPITRRLEHRPGVWGALRPERMSAHGHRPAQRALAALGYDTFQEGGHTLRRSGARALFDTLRDQGYDGALMRVSSMLGHKDTKMTEHYIGVGLERAQRNEMIAGHLMFPQLVHTDADVINIGRASGNDHTPSL